ncbi:MAG: hypothetical protein COV31_01090 [Candidatus Yanofskybacteria bacterium CG10_big_fil_rev_8_21_14_0_10_46_23]|uniref:ABC transmembrane type-1 domain-containing protein n=1 Tax=Candidatus Yanofskybacteria bacterium CG10_big_fil_rev_8_21_14_0_10_46_23 TaxID=1975098 RepID=A0A2H0R4J8_9BACT|nr:MAG: hypothetical protein COV31_01090 [Candidatus Yanofskybacteria bacterium CG10_big_fil_rev_8_21_14_0_10_46_23]
MKTRELVRKVYETYYAFRWAVLGVFGFITVSQILNLISPYLRGKVVDGFVNKIPIGEIYAIIGLAILANFTQVVLVRYFREVYESHYIDFSVRRHISRRMIGRLLQFSISQHANENSGVKMEVIKKGEHALTALAFQILYRIIPTIVEVAFLTSVLFYFSPFLGALALGGVVAYVLFVVFVNTHFRGDYERIEGLYNDSSKFQGEVLRNIESVIANAQEARIAREADINFGRALGVHQEMTIRFDRFALIRNSIIVLFGGGFLGIGAPWSIRASILLESW